MRERPLNEFGFEGFLFQRFVRLVRRARAAQSAHKDGHDHMPVRVSVRVRVSVTVSRKDSVGYGKCVC